MPVTAESPARNRQRRQHASQCSLYGIQPAPPAVVPAAIQHGAVSPVVQQWRSSASSSLPSPGKALVTPQKTAPAYSSAATKIHDGQCVPSAVEDQPSANQNPGDMPYASDLQRHSLPPRRHQYNAYRHCGVGDQRGSVIQHYQRHGYNASKQRHASPSRPVPPACVSPGTPRIAPALKSWQCRRHAGYTDI